MLPYILSYLGGLLTVASPCILPVLPFVFARAGKPFLRNGLPLLGGMAVMFAVVASLAAVGGGWGVAANRYARIVALGLLALFGASLLLPSLSSWATQPLVRAGMRLSRNAGDGSAVGTSLLLGMATGLLWTPCAGPILGLVLTAAALGGASLATTGLLLAYAGGAATALAAALLVSGRVFATMKRWLVPGEWVRRGTGGAVLVAVGAIGLGLDTDVLARIPGAGASRIEQHLVDRISGPQAGAAPETRLLPSEGTAPSFGGAVTWLNSPPLSPAALRGKVVVAYFWTYSCINCLRTIPYLRAWAERYRDEGLVVVGIHTPEFAFEKDNANVQRAVRDLKVNFPVAVDSDHRIWDAFGNRYWPAMYFIDARGQIRHHSFGEGDYDGSEQVIRQLLGEIHPKSALRKVELSAPGTQAEAGYDTRSPETYVGYDKAERFVSPGGAVADRDHRYDGVPVFLNTWTLQGNWVVGSEFATLSRPGGRIAYRFHARDLHLVLGTKGEPVRIRVTIDGKAPGRDHGTDTDAQGIGVISGTRLYQLVRQSSTIADRTVTIEFLDVGAKAYAFTFG